MCHSALAIAAYRFNAPIPRDPRTSISALISFVLWTSSSRGSPLNAMARHLACNRKVIPISRKPNILSQSESLPQPSKPLHHIASITCGFPPYWLVRPGRSSLPAGIINGGKMGQMKIVDHLPPISIYTRPKLEGTFTISRTFRRTTVDRIKLRLLLIALSKFG